MGEDEDPVEQNIPSVSSSAVQGNEKFEPRIGVGWNWKTKIGSQGAN